MRVRPVEVSKRARAKVLRRRRAKSRGDCAAPSAWRSFSKTLRESRVRVYPCAGVSSADQSSLLTLPKHSCPGVLLWDETGGG